jgi:hypothetical protein
MHRVEAIILSHNNGHGASSAQCSQSSLHEGVTWEQNQSKQLWEQPLTSHTFKKHKLSLPGMHSQHHNAMNAIDAPIAYACCRHAGLHSWAGLRAGFHSEIQHGSKLQRYMQAVVHADAATKLSNAAMTVFVVAAAAVTEPKTWQLNDSHTPEIAMTANQVMQSTKL